MRISDWSSDVCSSDLVAARMENAALAAAAPIATPGPARLAIPDLPARPGAPHPPADDADTPDNTVSNENPSDIETASLRMHGPTDAEPADESRSEEHKSELQSLMRTPYAFFCLKKKKK